MRATLLGIAGFWLGWIALVGGCIAKDSSVRDGDDEPTEDDDDDGDDDDAGDDDDDDSSPSDDDPGDSTDGDSSSTDGSTLSHEPNSNDSTTNQTESDAQLSTDSTLLTDDEEQADDADARCQRWLTDRGDLREATWTGNAESCQPGDLDAQGRERALTQMNLFRWMAGLEPVALDNKANERAQACALIMHANATLSHAPQPDWSCYTAQGGQQAGRSNIAALPGVEAVDAYMTDPGNPTTLGHRRWILFPGLETTGLGSTDAYSCMQTVGSGHPAESASAFVAWPPPGAFPSEAIALGWSSLNLTGWSIHSSTVDLSSASATVTANGTIVPMRMKALGQYFGDRWAISLIPEGWLMASNTTYHVTLDNVSSPIDYSFRVVDCE